LDDAPWGRICVCVCLDVTGTGKRIVFLFDCVCAPSRRAQRCPFGSPLTHAQRACGCHPISPLNSRRIVALLNGFNGSGCITGSVYCKASGPLHCVSAVQMAVSFHRAFPMDVGQEKYTSVSPARRVTRPPLPFFLASLFSFVNLRSTRSLI